MRRLFTFEAEPFEAYSKLDEPKRWTDSPCNCKKQITSRTPSFNEYEEEHGDVFSEFVDETEVFDTRLSNEEWQEEVNRNSRDYIRWVQRSLNQILGVSLVVDGISGPQTRSAIRSFQQRTGLVVNGIVGPMTERALIAAGATPPLGATPGHSTTNTRQIIVGGVALPTPQGLQVTNFHDPSVHRFTGQNRQGQAVDEVIVHETVTTSVANTVAVLRNRNLSVHFIIGPNGDVTQHGDLADDILSHAASHNTRSVGIEVVNPYYPRHLQPGLPWGQIIQAGWVHQGRYVLPTPQQAEATALLVGWLSSPDALGLLIPRTWIGASQGRLSMGRVTVTGRARAGIYAHTYFAHADGAWLVLYTWLRLAAGFNAQTAFTKAIQMATTVQNSVTLVV